MNMYPIAFGSPANVLWVRGGLPSGSIGCSLMPVHRPWQLYVSGRFTYLFSRCLARALINATRS